MDYSHTTRGRVTTSLDETMGRVLMSQEVWAMTGRLEIKFAKPVPLDQELTVGGDLTRSRSRTYEAQGRIEIPDGTVLVEGSGVCVRIPDEFVEQAKSELDFWEVIPDSNRLRCQVAIQPSVGYNRCIATHRGMSV